MEKASNIVCRVWNGLTKWEIMVRMNIVPSTKHEWEDGTKIHVQRRRLKSMLMNNTLIMLENTIQHHKLNSSEPNKCNNYDTATQRKTTETEMCGFCVGARSLIPTRVRIYGSVCSYLHALKESEHCLWCILSNITERKHSLSPLAFPPSPLNSSRCWRCGLTEHSMSWKEVRGQEKQSGVMATWCHQPKICSCQWGRRKGWSTCHSLLKTELSTQITELNMEP